MAPQRRGRARQGCFPAINSRRRVPASAPAVAETASGSPATLRGDEFTAAGLDRRPMWSDEAAAAAGDEDAPCRDGASYDAARRGSPTAVQIHTLKNGLRIERGGPCPSRRSDAERRRAPRFFRLATHALRPLKNGQCVLVGPTSTCGPSSGLKRHARLWISRPEISKTKFKNVQRLGGRPQSYALRVARFFSVILDDDCVKPKLTSSDIYRWSFKMSRRPGPTNKLEEVFLQYDVASGSHGYIPFAAADEALRSIGLDTSHG